MKMKSAIGQAVAYLSVLTSLSAGAAYGEYVDPYSPDSENKYISPFGRYAAIAQIYVSNTNGLRRELRTLSADYRDATRKLRKAYGADRADAEKLVKQKEAGIKEDLAELAKQSQRTVELLEKGLAKGAPKTELDKESVKDIKKALERAKKDRAFASQDPSKFTRDGAMSFLEAVGAGADEGAKVLETPAGLITTPLRLVDFAVGTPIPDGCGNNMVVGPFQAAGMFALEMPGAILGALKGGAQYMIDKGKSHDCDSSSHSSIATAAGAKPETSEAGHSGSSGPSVAEATVSGDPTR